jgi:L-alanine-DL-glutamate epimerase-like enolase superfamily enzyme
VIDIKTIRVALPLKAKFVVAGGSASVKTNVITILNNRYSGEAAASVYYGPTIEQIECDLRRGVSYLKRWKNITLQTLEAISRYKIHPIARSALTAMVLNYISGETRRYPWEVLSLGTPLGIRNSITISIGSPSEMIDAIRAADYPILKIKMGSPHDREVVERLEGEQLGREIRVDANGGWTPEMAEEMIFRLAKLGVIVIEQPTTVTDIADWPHLKGKNADVVLLLDEGLETIEDYRQYHDHIDGVNIKMEKSGGILQAADIARAVRKDNKKVMLGCMVESSVGIAQSVYMSSLADYHDLDSPQLLESDIADGIIYDRETIRVDREIIGGPWLKREIVEKYIRD